MRLNSYRLRTALFLCITLALVAGPMLHAHGLSFLAADSCCSASLAAPEGHEETGSSTCPACTFLSHAGRAILPAPVALTASVAAVTPLFAATTTETAPWLYPTAAPRGPPSADPTA